MISKGPYSFPVDIWALGVILFVLLSGEYPFYHSDILFLFKTISAGNVSFASASWEKVSSDAKDLIRHMLHVDASQRYTIPQILAHPWIQETHQRPVIKYSSSRARRRWKMCILAVLVTVRLRYLLPRKRLCYIPIIEPPIDDCAISSTAITRPPLYAAGDHYSLWQRCKLLFRVRPPRPLLLSSFVFRLQESPEDSFADFNDLIK